MWKSYLFAVTAAAVLSGPCWGGDFVTGQAARAIIGQPFFNAQNAGAASTTPAPAGGPRRPRRPASLQGTPITLLGAASGVAYVNNTLFVVDDNHLGFTPDNNRVLIYPNINQTVPAATAEIPPQSGRCPVCGGTATVVLGQPDFDTTTTTPTVPITASSMHLPTAVATDGHILAVADTSNNRVLLWKSIPTVNGQAADIVLGQTGFTSVALVTVTASAMRGPQGVWIQGSKLFVADTQNNRILIWNTIPTQNNQPADLVLGQPNFTTSPPINQVDLTLTAAANIMLSPTSVTSDGTHLFVADLGYNRVLIWNTIPTTNQAPANFEIGQVDMTKSISNDTAHLCASNGTDSSGNATYPGTCAFTLNFPRFALSDGTRLFVADGGNDRVLVYNSIPQANAVKADAILGEPDDVSDVFSSNDSTTLSTSNVVPTPTSLAWDPVNQNLYVADPTDFRILVFSPEQASLAPNSIVNAASKEVFAAGSVVVGGTITAGNDATITLGNPVGSATNTIDYKYTVLSADTLETVAVALTKLINAGKGDPNVLAIEDAGLATIHLLARQPGSTGNNLTLSTTLSTNATLTLTASASNLSGGASAAIIAPGTVVLIRGTNLSDVTASWDSTQSALPFSLGGVEVYFDGIRAGLFSVSPTVIRAAFPYQVTGANSVTAWVRIAHADGSVTVTTAIGVPVEEQAPGIFADETPGAAEPRTAVAIHTSSFATGTITVAGSVQAGDTASITIGDATYSYTVVSTDTLTTIETNLVNLIKADPNSPVLASAGPLDFNIRLQAMVPGPDGNGVAISTSTSTLSTNTSGVQVTLTATNTALCCASVAGAAITAANPALPGETITIYATGLGLICSSQVVNSFCSVIPDPGLSAIVDGAKYTGPAVNAPFFDVSAQVAGSSATVISASLIPGQIGVYAVQLEINSSVTADALAQATITQNLNTSNIVTIPVGRSPTQ
ncbi:MAG: hypothetical protein M3N41_00440 [Acidobacteriota bacterium]|nr:hypothetical protein [Acidobacteriota bacterium]